MRVRDIEDYIKKDFGVCIDAGINKTGFGKGLDAVFNGWNGMKDFVQVKRPDLDKIFGNLENIEVAFDLDSDEGRYFSSIVPSIFYYKKDDSIYYNCLYGDFFYRVEEERDTIVIRLLQEEPRHERIVDLYQVTIYDVNAQVARALNDIKNAYSEFIRKISYTQESNIRYRTVEVPENKYYDHIYSLTKEESERMHKWQGEHRLKYHKEDSKFYRGAISVSDYYINIGTTSIGTFVECICGSCMNKKLDKEEYTYTVRNLDD